MRGNGRDRQHESFAGHAASTGKSSLASSWLTGTDSQSPPQCELLMSVRAELELPLSGESSVPVLVTGTVQFVPVGSVGKPIAVVGATVLLNCIGDELDFAFVA